MADIQAGSAYISIRPNMAGFHQAVGRAVTRGLGQAARRAGEQAGREVTEGLERETSRSAPETGREIGDEVGQGLRGALDRTMQRIGPGLNNAMAGIAVAAGAAFSMALSSAMDVTAARGKLQAQLGLTAAESQRVGKVAGSLYADAYGESMEEINTAVSSVIRNMDGMRDASSSSLRETTARAVTLANVMDADVGEVTRSVSQMLRTGLASSAEEAFDILTRGAQTGANAADDLLETYTEYGTQFRNMGLSGQQAMGLLTQGLKAGARDADLVADAIKEFSIEAVAGSDRIRGGYEELGLSADDMFAALGKGGPDAAKALDITLDKLREVEDPVERNAIATELFGTMAEDLGDALYALDPSTAVAGLGELEGATDRAGKAMQETPQARFERFKRGLQTTVVNTIVDDVIPVLERLGSVASGLGITPGGMAQAGIAIAGVAAAYKGVSVAISGAKAVATGASTALSVGRSVVSSVSGLSGAWTTLRIRSMYAGDAIRRAATAVRASTAAHLASARAATASAVAATRQRIAAVASAVAARTVRLAMLAWAAAQWLLNAAMSANPLTLIIIAIVAVIAIVVVAWKRFDWFRNAVMAVWNAIKVGASAAWEGIKTAISVAWSLIQPVFNLIKWYVLNVLLAQFKLLWAGVKVVWSGVLAAIKGAWAVIQLIWSGIQGHIKALIAAFKLLWAGVKVVWSGVWNAIKAAWNFIRPVFETIRRIVRVVLAGAFQFLASVGRTAWNGLRSGISTAWNGIKGVFNALRSGVDAVKRGFQIGVDAIKRIWDRLKSITKAPVRFFVETVYMGGVRKVWSGVRKLVPALPDLPSVRFADGGILSGYSPGRDVHRFFSPTGGWLDLSGGEGILRPEFTRSLGPRFINAGNAAARQGGTAGVAKFLGEAGDPGRIVPGFKNGGILSFRNGGILGALRKPFDMAKNAASPFLTKGAEWVAKSILEPILTRVNGLSGSGLWSQALTSIPKRMINSFLDFIKKVVEPNLGGGGSNKAVRAALSQIGVPYSWGGGSIHGPTRGIGRGANTVGFDCSSLMMYAWHKATGKTMPRTTYTQKPFLRRVSKPVPGAVGQPHPGHTYMAVNNREIVEAPYTGAHVRRTGMRTTPWWGVPPWKYDNGGWLQPGISTVLNATRKPEAVLTGSQLSALVGASTGGGDTHYHAHFDGMTRAAYEQQMRAGIQAEAVLAAQRDRPGRRR